jgi:hypothetical protein
VRDIRTHGLNGGTLVVSDAASPAEWASIYQLPKAVALTPGTRFGAYEILSAIGAVGMGKVYRARDARLERTKAPPTTWPSRLIARVWSICRRNRKIRGLTCVQPTAHVSSSRGG